VKIILITYHTNTHYTSVNQAAYTIKINIYIYNTVLAKVFDKVVITALDGYGDFISIIESPVFPLPR
jgi:hypothetical protein